MNNTINAGAGNDFISLTGVFYSYYNYKGINGNTLIQYKAGDGNDTIRNYGESSLNSYYGQYVTINGGKGNDLISNSGENVLYQYASGDGKDTISGFGENDTLKITKGTIKSSVVSGSDLILTVGTGSITLKDVTGTEINLIDEKGNASTLEIPFIHTLTKKADYFANEDEGYKVDALAGNDSIENYAANATLDAGDGNDEIFNVGNDSSLFGGKGNDSIDNFADDVTINGGAGNDYILNAGEGNIFQYASGDGKDTISGFGENDTIHITSGNLKNATVKGMDVILNVGSGSITLEDAAGKNINIMDSTGKLSSTNLSGV